MEITLHEFMKMQPHNPKVTESDKYYLQLAMRLGKLWDNSHKFTSLPERMRKAIVLAVVGYYQDIIADAGIWRSFTMLHNHLYGKPLPFYEPTEDYIAFELNLDDVKFLIWYTAEGYSFDNFKMSPLDGNIAWLAQLFYQVLDEEYETAPTPAEYNLAIGVDTHDVEDANAIYDLSHWLFFDCYFLKPAAKLAIARSLKEAKAIVEKNERDVNDKLQDLDDRTMLNNPTGPLSLTIGEWIDMIVNGKMPEWVDEPKAQPHKLYSEFTAANDGNEIAFFESYTALEQFLVEKMGWQQQEDGVLPPMKQFHNFVILGNHDKGILIAHDVAQYIAHPGNTLYDKEAVMNDGYMLVTKQGKCPVDLVKYIFSHGLAPDAALPGDDTKRLLPENWDFLARLYQQAYYND